LSAGELIPHREAQLKLVLLTGMCNRIECEVKSIFQLLPNKSHDYFLHLSKLINHSRLNFSNNCNQEESQLQYDEETGIHQLQQGSPQNKLIPI
jgi:hypothetical protein